MPCYIIYPIPHLYMISKPWILPASWNLCGTSDRSLIIMSAPKSSMNSVHVNRYACCRTTTPPSNSSNSGFAYPAYTDSPLLLQVVLFYIFLSSIGKCLNSIHMAPSGVTKGPCSVPLGKTAYIPVVNISSGFFTLAALPSRM